MHSFSEDIHTMTGRRPNIFWRACWLVISPLYLLIVFVAYVAVQADKHPNYPAWDPSHVRAACTRFSRVRDTIQNQPWLLTHGTCLFLFPLRWISPRQT